MKFSGVSVSLAIVASLAISPLVAAKTLSQLSTDLTVMRTAVTRIQQEDLSSTKEEARESSSELFPAMEGGKVILTPAQQSLVKRCERMKKMNARCKAVVCRLTGEQCKK